MTSRGVPIGENPPWLVRLDTCSSTNDWALKRLDQLANGVAVWTACQTAGRGRQGQPWQAPDGATAVSFVFHLDQAEFGSHLSLAAGLAVCHAIEDVCPHLNCAIKWPNDVYLQDRKIAGVLCEAQVDKSGLSVVIGIGINRANTWTADQQASLRWPATSLAEHGPAPNEFTLLDHLRDHLMHAIGLLKSQRWDAMQQQLEHRDWLRGRLLSIEDITGTTTGSAAGIDEHGQLLVITGNGAPTPINAGTVTILTQDRMQP